MNIDQCRNGDDGEHREGADTITLVGDNGPTKINAPNTGTNDTINIRSTGGLTTVNTSEGATSTINVRSLSPAAGGW